MKRTLMTALLCLFPALAFGVADERLSLGLEGSLNFASSNQSDVLDQTWKGQGLNTGSRTGLMFGLRAERPMSRYFSLQGELMYSQKGFGLDMKDEDLVGDAKIHYLSTALFGKVKLIPDGPVRPYVYAGPEVGFRLASSTSIGTREGIVQANVPLTYSDTDVDLDGGIGVEASVAKDISIFTDLRYSYGLFNILENAREGVSIRTSTWQAMGGVKVAL